MREFEHGDAQGGPHLHVPSGCMSGSDFLDGVAQKVRKRRAKRRMASGIAGAGALAACLAVVWFGLPSSDKGASVLAVTEGSLSTLKWLEREFDSVPEEAFPEDYQWMAEVWIEPEYGVD